MQLSPWLPVAMGSAFMFYFIWYKSEGTTCQLPDSLGLLIHARHFELNGKTFNLYSLDIDDTSLQPTEVWTKLLKKNKKFNTITFCLLWWTDIPDSLKDYLLKVRNFIQTVDSLALYIIIKIGPAACSNIPERIFKRDGTNGLRAHGSPNTLQYKNGMDKYLEDLVRHIEDLQITRNGPIIGFMLDTDYMTSFDQLSYLVEHLRYYGIQELFMAKVHPEKICFYSKIVLPIIRFEKNNIHVAIKDLENFNQEYPIVITDIPKEFQEYVQHLYENSSIIIKQR